MNPVLIVLSLFAAAFGCAGFWLFLSTLSTRKIDTKVKSVDAAVDLETASRDYRKEVAADRDAKQRKLNALAAVVIPFLRTIDSFMPKMMQCLTVDETLLARSQADAVWKAIEP